MKKNISLAIAIALFSVTSISAQGFLKKLEDATKKTVKTEKSKDNNQQNADKTTNAAPVSIEIGSTRIIGNKLLISAKMEASEDFRLMNLNALINTPDGEIYKLSDIWWGGSYSSISIFDKKLVEGINYAFDLCFEIKSKTITDINSLVIDAFNHTKQQVFKIPFKGIIVPYPVDARLTPSTFEIHKNVYLRWTKVEEAKNSFKINFVVENKDSKDQTIQFGSFNNAKIIDTDGNSYAGVLTLKDNVTFPTETPIAGSITIDKPLKISQISLLEFSSAYFNYRIRKVIISD